jgi:hypothetical protein
MSRNYEKQESEVEVIYLDGEVKAFTITAGNGIAHHLMKEAAQTGMLVMRDDVAKKSICIPLAQVRHISIQTIDPNAVIEGAAR